MLSKTTYSDDRSHIRRIKRIQVFLLDNSRCASCSRRATIILIVWRKFSNTHDISIGLVFWYSAVSKAVRAPSFTGITLEPRSNITPQCPVMMLTIWFSLENRRQNMPSWKKTDTFWILWLRFCWDLYMRNGTRPMPIIAQNWPTLMSAWQSPSTHLSEHSAFVFDALCRP